MTKVVNTAGKLSPLEFESHLSVSRYGKFVLTEAVRPSFDLKVVPSEGYRHDRYSDENTGASIPVLMISVSAEKIFDVFLDLLQPLGGTVDAVLESSHLRKIPGHKDVRREQIDLPVLTSYLFDYEHLFLADGCVGIAVLNPAIPAEVQWDEHKLITVYADNLKPYEKVLRKYNIPHRQDIRLISEAEHVHITRKEYAGQFNALKTLICAE
ncbi:MAG: hypothetical protein FWE67_13560 [Planctomycetaceae bacterium]|nr:hypothetical protein [Planctomycetaceae bacterium]